MCKSIFVIFLFFTSLEVTGQTLDEEKARKWSYDAFSYADFGTQEQHSYFSILYELNPKLHAELQGFYDSYLTADIFDLSARVKWYPGSKVYLFSGLGIQIQRDKGFGELPIMPVRMLNGLGYKPNSNMTIEAVHDLSFGQNGTLSPFTLKGKYRF